MEERREVRFLIPPFVFLFSLLWSEYAAHGQLWCYLVAQTTSDKSLLGGSLLVAGAVIPLGFLISSVTIFFLRSSFFLWWHLCPVRCRNNRTWSYEIQIPRALITEGIWPRIRQSTSVASPKKAFHQLRRYDLPIYGTFDHLNIEKKVRDWIGRRWNMFLVSAHSITAIVLANFFVTLIGLDFRCGGSRRWIPTVLATGLLLCNACVAYREAMRMSEVQVRRLI